MKSAWELDKKQLEFLHWIQTYNNIMTNVPGQDRADAIAVMDDDELFDQWLRDYKRKMAAAGKTTAPSSGKPRVSVSKDDFFKKMGTVKG